MEALRPLSITAVAALLRAPPVPISTFVGTGREVGGRRGKSVRAGAGWLWGLLGRKGGGGAPTAMTVTPGTVKAGDPVLHEPAQEVSPGDVPSEKIQGVIDQMIAVMRKAPGVGLAAPQIGVPLKIIVLEDTQEYISYASKEDIDAQDRRSFDLLVGIFFRMELCSPPITVVRLEHLLMAHALLCFLSPLSQVVINPKLRKTSKRTARFYEGCLSVDGYRAVVERHLDVEVSGFDRNGHPMKVEASGWQARILQHECDHLEGTLYVDKMVPRTFRTVDNLNLPLATGCPPLGA
ncbi:peptide deformylase 1A, chloroplastic isoform X1 [Aegilops tauschii subsp. strangulata]|nr:peptide deformylase 1A, chloroplastic isoform X1 [Aegilops tauschii subsp. strangulata]